MLKILIQCYHWPNNYNFKGLILLLKLILKVFYWFLWLKNLRGCDLTFGCGFLLSYRSLHFWPRIWGLLFGSYCRAQSQINYYVWILQNFSLFADWLPPSSLQSPCNRKIQVISRCYTAMQSRCKDRWMENNNFELSLYQYKTVEYIMSIICQKLPLFKCHIVDTINENFISCL